MMAKQDNFDFDTESKAKFSLDFGFLKNLTQKQKEMILMITIGVIALIVIVVVGVILMTANGGNGGNNGGGNISGGAGDNGSGETGDTENGDTENEGNEIPDEITQFYISSKPNKTFYYVGDSADYSGLIVYIKSEVTGSKYIAYDDDPDAFTITGFDSSAPVAEQTITVECRGFTDTFTIKVEELPVSAPKLVSIHFSTYPKQIYSIDDKFSYKDGVLVCTYSDDSTVEIPLKLNYIYGTDAIFDPTYEHNLLPGEYTLVVEYTENGVSVQTEYTITVY